MSFTWNRKTSKNEDQVEAKEAFEQVVCNAYIMNLSKEELIKSIEELWEKYQDHLSKS